MIPHFYFYEITFISLQKGATIILGSSFKLNLILKRKVDFRSRLLAFLWASVEPLPPLALRAGSRLSRFPTGVE